MSVILIARFINNRSATTIGYKKYSDTAVDIYPAFSICFTGSAEFHWFYELDLFNDLGLNSMQYERILKGKLAFKYKYDPATRLYKRHPTSNFSEFDGSSEPYRIKMSDIIVQAHFTAENEIHSIHYGSNTDNRTSKNQPLNLGIQTPNKICFTRYSNYIFELIRLKDTVTLHKGLMKNPMYNDTKIDIYIHHPGQLIQVLESPSYSSLFHEYKWEKDLNFQILQHTIVRKRPDSSGTCNREIKDYDLYLQRIIIEKNKCVPLFWKEKFSGVTGLKDCTAQEQFKNVYDAIKDINKIKEQHDIPCIEVHLVTAWNSVEAKGSSSENETYVRFRYKDKYYQEIIHLEEFGPESFISNMGGFLGIFLGYSMLQVPDLLGKNIDDWSIRLIKISMRDSC